MRWPRVLVRRPERCKNCRAELGPVPVRESPLAWCSERCRDVWVEWWVLR